MTRAALRAAELLLAGGLFVGAGALIVPSRPVVVPIMLPSGRVIHAELARTAAERARGLMFRRSMPADAGMLIVFPTAGRHAIWMKNCRFPLDLVWLDAQGRVVTVFERAPPCTSATCTIYWPARPADYVLELMAGSAMREGLTPPATIRRLRDESAPPGRTGIVAQTLRPRPWSPSTAIRPPQSRRSRPARPC